MFVVSQKKYDEAVEKLAKTVERVAVLEETVGTLLTENEKLRAALEEAAAKATKATAKTAAKKTDAKKTAKTTATAKKTTKKATK